MYFVNRQKKEIKCRRQERVVKLEHQVNHNVNGWHTTTVMRMQEHSVPTDPWPANPHPIMVALESHCSISLFKMSGLMNFIYFSE